MCTYNYYFFLLLIVSIGHLFMSIMGVVFSRAPDVHLGCTCALLRTEEFVCGHTDDIHQGTVLVNVHPILTLLNEVITFVICANKSILVAS